MSPPLLNMRITKIQNNEPDLILVQKSNTFVYTYRKKQFLNPIKPNSAFTNLDGNVNLSEEMKSFSILAQEKRQPFIKNTLMQKTSTNTWQAIPVTKQEAEMLKNEKMMKKEELISDKIYMLTILQEIQGLNNFDEVVGEDDVNKEAVGDDDVNKEPEDEEAV
ncbi:hypothetical protein C2G38_2200622 [Gigaspora rosea]|uniref:Uncharacterized protein n=1 Tax=Gigaspora rosea TaxID=44941 RepID=A0A397UY46_9GLOM|nr:hypothetical protein C2G38_2200622 [Gigaspora rosea]